MEFVQNHYVVNALLNRRPAKVMVDTGASGSGLLPNVAEAMGLPYDVDRSIIVSGAGGGTEAQHPATVHSFKVGNIDFPDVAVPTLNMLSMDAGAGPVGLMGADMLSKYDVEFDFPNRTMALWSASGCTNLHLPWIGRVTVFRATRIRRNAFMIPVGLNGHIVRALLDTGSDSSQLAREAAIGAGVTPQALDADKTGTRYGVSGKAMKSHLHHFETVRIGPEIFRDTGVIVADEMKSDDVDMLLGLDFMRRRKVWVSYTTNKVFIQAVSVATGAGAMQAPSLTPHLSNEPVVATVASKDVPIAPSPIPNQPARPIDDPVKWLSAESYPATALRMGQQGVVDFELRIDETGHATGCSITHPSASISLDTATCAIARRKLFHPATDSQGKAVSGLYSSSIRWKMP